MMNSLKLCFSPCPNDTFIFDALVNRRIQVPFQFEVFMDDVEQLNERARNNEGDIIKISFANYPFVSDEYQILSAGSALGYGCGPLLVGRNSFIDGGLKDQKVGIPGFKTTAHLLLTIFYPDLLNKKEFLFSVIEDEILSGKIDLGLLIHESRFTFEQKGLRKVSDLGAKWEEAFGWPIPLGCIAVKRNLDEHLKLQIQNTLRASIEWAFAHPKDSLDFIREHASEMDAEVQQKHIGLYVNQFSIDLGKEGRAAARFLFERGHLAGLLPLATEPVFIETLDNS